MTPEQEVKLLDSLGLRVEVAADTAFDRLQAQRVALGDGRADEAAAAALRPFNADVLGIMREGLAAVREQEVSEDAVRELMVNGSALSVLLDQHARETAAIVGNVEAEHAAAFEAVREEARRLFESYGEE